MRRQIIATLVAMVVGVVLLYGVPRAYWLSELVHSTEQRETHRAADVLAVAVDERRAGGGQVEEDFLAQLVHTGEAVTVTVDGGTLRVGTDASQDSPDDIVAVRGLAGGGELSLRRADELVSDRVGEALVPVGLLGLVLIVAAGLLVKVLADRLSRPFRELAGIADAVGRGHFDVSIPHYRVPEAEAIGGSMRRGISRLAELRRRERDIASNASHELRSPISALRMEIEDLASWPETPPVVAAELHSYLPQLDRLNAAVRTYLDAAEAQRLLDVDVVDLSALVRESLDRWRSRLRGPSAPRLVVVDEPTEAVHVCASDSAVTEVLDHLLTDAVHRLPTHVLVEIDSTDGYGRVRLELEGARADGGGGVREGTEVADGRAAAAETALAVGGRVISVDGQTVVLLRLAGEDEDDSPTTDA
ncbi:hypothetical protein GCM10009584_04540 [Ornithinimicrobium humiphilum]|uniref:histidine kinase n=1 Tax=Ornithinimicrobium humiphilum TaxID=125288 RepID=A0A543K7X0_9MICO|nr:HAMP domain-containing histidine kinase [Ornithinimicrobium humiphilum]TQM91182.1 signal transduction histidine kinase [Ornithinimicrobium humiphilum]